MFDRQKVILITDPNSDPDDLASFMVLADLYNKGKVELSAVVVTAGCREVREKRAKFTAAVFKRLGMNDVPIACGADYPLLNEEHENTFWENSAVDAFLSESDELISNDAQSLMLDVLEKAEDNSVSLLLNAPMADAENLIAADEVLCRRKLNKIVVMGGIETEPDGQGIYQPSATSHNNRVCLKAACKLFEFAQRNDIKLVLMPKETVYQVQISKGFYDEIEKSDNLLAQALWQANYQFLGYLWLTVKRGEYSHFDVKRFAKVFIGNDFTIRSRVITARSAFAEVWQKIKFFNMYDALTALALTEDIYEPTGYYERLGEKNIFIAKIRDADMLRTKMCSIIKQKLNENDGTVGIC